MPPIQTPFGSFTAICRMIRIEHSVFALPYAYAGAVLAAGGMPSWGTLIALTVAMIGVRSVAMAFNRIMDLPFDSENPRTWDRPLVTGEISVKQTWSFCGIMSLVFIFACAFLNQLCLYLSIPALLFAAAYSVTKRFTTLCHYWLGATLGLAPLAGWLAVSPDSLGMPAILLFFAVTFWTGAFDIYYAFQDYDFDQVFNLYSVPAVYGPDAAMAIAGVSHVVTSIFLLLTGYAAGLAWPWYFVWLVISGVLFWEHKLVKPDDLRNINMAFFTLNGVVSIVMLIGVILGVLFNAA